MNNLKLFLLTNMIVALPVMAFAENWIEFHQEKWSHKSGKLNRKLKFSNRYYYDAQSLVKTSSGDVNLWVKEVADNDSYYVRSGNPQSETIFRKIHLWCGVKKYEILQADEEDIVLNELIGEEIRPESSYEKLFLAGCLDKVPR